MKAIKVFNHNAVSTVMPDGREAIVLGTGIGFHKRPGDPVEERCIEKVYYVQDEMQTKFLQMLQNVDRGDVIEGTIGKRQVGGRGNLERCILTEQLPA